MSPKECSLVSQLRPYRYVDSLWNGPPCVISQKWKIVRRGYHARRLAVLCVFLHTGFDIKYIQDYTFLIFKQLELFI